MNKDKMKNKKGLKCNFILTCGNDIVPYHFVSFYKSHIVVAFIMCIFFFYLFYIVK